MSSPLLAVGDIVSTTTKSYRVISLTGTDAVLCEMNIQKLILLKLAVPDLLTIIEQGEASIEKDEAIVFDIDKFDEKAQAKFFKKKQMMTELVNAYSPSFEKLYGKQPKPKVEELIKKYECPRNTFWRTCTLFFQSGMRDVSLVDPKALRGGKRKPYSYTKKPGKKPEYLGNSGVVITEEIQGYFDEALKEYRAKRQTTLKDAYTSMNRRHFIHTVIVDGRAQLELLPESERPTIRQFNYYAGKVLTPEEKDEIATSAAEQRNNKRLLLSDVLEGVYGPCDMVEIDACEADVSLVSSLDPNQTIGRPVVYFMVDVFSRIILAMSVAFDNNSNLGVTNLFLNLADDKKKFCARYGIEFDQDELWPSNVIPRRIRLDRGSEFVSKNFSRICTDLGIEKEVVPGASGSLKGVVEQSFHQMHRKQNPHLENHGLIEKRYDSEHHKEAELTLEQYTKMVIMFVLTHNQRYLDEYPLSRELLDKDVKPIPILLWKYGCSKFGNPRPVTATNQYLYHLLTPVKAKIDRRGIHYKNLIYYLESDRKLSGEMFRAGNKKVPFEARMDMRDVGVIYYLRDGELLMAPLNPRISSNQGFEGMTMKQYEDYRKKKGKLSAEGRIHNENLDVFHYAVNKDIVDEAKKTAYSNTKNIRPARELEKQTVSNEGRIRDRIEKPVAIEETNLGEQPVLPVEIPKESVENTPKLPNPAEKYFLEDGSVDWDAAIQDVIDEM